MAKYKNESQCLCSKTPKTISSELSHDTHLIPKNEINRTHKNSFKKKKFYVAEALLICVKRVNTAVIGRTFAKRLFIL